MLRKQLLKVMSCSLAITAMMTAAAHAHFDVVPYAWNGKITTGGHDDVLGLDSVTERVFGYDFGEDPMDPYFIGDPGFNNGAFAVGVYPNNGLLPTFSTLGLVILTDLSYWDGSGPVLFAPAPAGVDLGITRGSNTVHISSSGLTGTTPTIGSTGASGRLHVHVQSTLNAADGFDPAPPNAPDGIYLVGLKLTLPGSNVADSDPIYFVYNNSLDEETHDAAIDWVETNLVPEPSSWLLLALGSMALVAAGWRKRTPALA